MCKLLKLLGKLFYEPLPSWPQNDPPHPSELFKGVTKPTVTLAHMMVAEMLQNLDVTSKKEIEDKGEPYEKLLDITKFKTFTVKIDEGYTRMYSFTGLPNQRHFLLSKELLSASFDKDEMKILSDGFDKFLDLRAKQNAVKKEADRQQAAIDAIAARFPKEDEVKPAPEPIIVETPSLPDIDTSFLKVIPSPKRSPKTIGL